MIKVIDDDETSGDSLYREGGREVTTNYTGRPEVLRIRRFRSVSVGDSNFIKGTLLHIQHPVVSYCRVHPILIDTIDALTFFPSYSRFNSFFESFFALFFLNKFRK